MNRKNTTLFLFVSFIITISTPLSFGELGELSVEEFKEAIEKPERDYQYIQDQFDFPILEREFFEVYGRMANGDVEEAIRIFSDPNYPESVFGSNEPTTSIDGVSYSDLLYNYPIILGIVLCGIAAFIGVKLYKRKKMSRSTHT